MRFGALFQQRGQQIDAGLLQHGRIGRRLTARQEKERDPWEALAQRRVWP
jgi:hypothetical protein